VIAVAPGRVNIIGEHTDYNCGFVLPAAINQVTVVAAGPGPAGVLAAYSERMHSLVRLPLETLRPSKTEPWANYPAGIAYFLHRNGVTVRGTNLCIVSSIAQGAGLSSSAALEVACARALLALGGEARDALQVIELCRQAESEFAGVNCGIMDQYVAWMGKQGNALILDCRSVEHQYVPLPPGIRLLVCDTGARRELMTSEYNRRRQECLYAVKQLAALHPGVRSLRDVSPGQIALAEGRMDQTAFKRARHVVSENDRVVHAVQAFRAANLDEVGNLMYESHVSLRSDFEVSCPELDAVVDICAESEGVFGARLTGAGFGGSVICLVLESEVDPVRSRLKEEYLQRTGLVPEVHVCSIEDGASVVTL
jgi:galactokinase